MSNRHYNEGSNLHHLIYPRRLYTEQHESRFRQQPFFKEPIPIPVHDLLHLKLKEPPKVPAHIMFEVIAMDSVTIDPVLDMLDFHKESKARRLADHLFRQLDIIQTPVDEALDYLRSRGWNR